MATSTLSKLCRAFMISTLFGLATAAPPLRAAGPCDTVNGDAPHPPGGQPEPFIGGHVRLGQTTGVSGATVRLHRCSGSTDEVVATDLTASDGSFLFDAVSGPSWYYVLADLSGPLNGYSAVSGPTLIPIGPAAPAIDLLHH